VDHYSIQIMQCPDQADQVRRLFAFLESVMSLQTRQERLEKYQEAWANISPNVKNIVWDARASVNFPWDGKERLWKTLRGEIETKFTRTGVICDECTREMTMRPIEPFCFIDYSTMLGGLLDIFLKGLSDYIDIQDHITTVSVDMDEYNEDERYMSEKMMCYSRIRRARDFLDVILFLHAVPQRATDRWDALDLESDVTWFREHCEVYQQNEELMAFLRDCAVVVLITGFFDVPKDVRSIWECYRELDLYSKVHDPPSSFLTKKKIEMSL
jgi:hypothetical protein